MVNWYITYTKGTLKIKGQQRTYLIMLIQCFVFFFPSDFFYKTMCYGYSFELHRQVHEISNGYPQHIPL